MVYTPTVWQNDQAPALNEINLDNIEQGLIDAHAAALYARYLWGPLLPYLIASQAFGTAGRVYMIPIDVPWRITIDRIIYQVGIVGAGNVRLGIYREGATADSPAGADLVVESASVAQAGVNNIQMVTVADTVLTPGQYFSGIQGDNIAGTFYRSLDSGQVIARRYDRGGGYGAFTDPCPAVVADAGLPFLGLRIKENSPIII